MSDPSQASRHVVLDLVTRLDAGDDNVLDDLVASDFVNHAAGPQGREGWRRTIETLRHDLGEFSFDNHHLLADGQFVALHQTLHGRHVRSTMPLLTGLDAHGAAVEWTFMHIFRIQDGKVVEHWACRDDLGLLRQIGAWPPNPSRSTPDSEL